MILSKTEIRLQDRVEDRYLGDWTLLELALMLDHRQCADALLQNGATVDVDACSFSCRLKLLQERSELVSYEIQCLKNNAIQNKDRVVNRHGRVDWLQQAFFQTFSSQLKKITFQDNWKQLQYLEKRLTQLKKMKAVVEHTIVPGPLTDVEAVVSGSDQLTIWWKDVRQHNMDSVVNYKVEWSLCDDFSSIEGSSLVNTISKNYAVISGLKRGLRYSVRVSAASIRGYGHPVRAVPQLLLISSKLHFTAQPFPEFKFAV
ncbi:unnamed protein product [Gongylonema pulchrum]|uniref:Fibronectin type-III domain-containing protein n=1 Tax=Gongylonema pulchrum TaxID=637853 RepID=A0A183E255_9BILA|nr:unnamed protein product [Gongylonema pulchrum]